MSDEPKKISIVGTSNRYQIKRVSQDKEIKTRTKMVNLDIEPGVLDNQLKIVEELLSSGSLVTDEHKLFTREINSKISSYRQQDISKKMLDDTKFINFEQVLTKLCDCKLCCFYCGELMLIVYTIVREKMQWSLDRVDNDLGHNSDNVVISCLQCNLQRRRKSKNAFEFTKKMVLTRSEY